MALLCPFVGLLTNPGSGEIMGYQLFKEPGMYRKKATRKRSGLVRITAAQLASIKRNQQQALNQIYSGSPLLFAAPEEEDMEIEETNERSKKEYICEFDYKGTKYKLDITNITRNKIKIKVQSKRTPNWITRSRTKTGKFNSGQGYNRVPARINRNEIEELIIHGHVYAKNKIDTVVNEEEILTYAKDFCMSDMALVQSGFEKAKNVK